MAEVHQSAASLRFRGDNVDPEEISEELGCLPTSGAKKGGLYLSNGRQMVARSGFWSLKVGGYEVPGDLDKQIAEILSLLTDDLSIWRNLTARYNGEIFAGLMLQRSNEGINISAATSLALGSRGLSLELDIYSGADEEEPWETFPIAE